MPRQLNIDDHIEFRGSALHRSNVEGPMQETQAHFHDHFLSHTLDTTFKYTSTAAGTAATNTIQPTVGGQCRFLTGTVDGNAQFLATAINYEDDMNAKCEARIRIDDVSCTGLFFGFSDATSETTPEMPIDGDVGVIAKGANTTNAVGFVVDADYLTSSIMCCGSAAGTLDTSVDAAKDWADGEWHTLRVELTPAGYAFFFLDGESVGFLDAAVTSGTALCMIIGVATRTTGAKHVHLDRWDAWQDQGE